MIRIWSPRLMTWTFRPSTSGETFVRVVRKFGFASCAKAEGAPTARATPRAVSTANSFFMGAPVSPGRGGGPCAGRVDSALWSAHDRRPAAGEVARHGVAGGDARGHERGDGGRRSKRDAQLGGGARHERDRGPGAAQQRGDERADDRREQERGPAALDGDAGQAGRVLGRQQALGELLAAVDGDQDDRQDQPGADERRSRGGGGGPRRERLAREQPHGGAEAERDERQQE